MRVLEIAEEDGGGGNVDVDVESNVDDVGDEADDDALEEEREEVVDEKDDDDDDDVVGQEAELRMAWMFMMLSLVAEERESREDERREADNRPEGSRICWS